jgi:hypothetical protein
MRLGSVLLWSSLSASACTGAKTETSPSTTSSTSTWDPDAPLAERCFPTVGDPASGVPEYDAFAPVVPRDCAGTDHQAIGDLDRVVFLGDSITAGTPPTPEDGYYRNLLVASLEADFGHPVETQDCSVWGARVDDLFRDHSQIADCLGTQGVDLRATLVVFTVGGNDMFAFAQDMLDGGTLEQVTADVDATIALFRESVDVLTGMRPRFPNGLSVVFGNLYEYTDGTGDLSLCPNANLLGFDGVIPEIRDEYVRVNEAWVQTAVETDTDVVFMLEHFCGHGFLAGDPDNECFRGDDAEVWFDPTCIHPNPVGHEQLADLFRTVVRH